VVNFACPSRRSPEVRRRLVAQEYGRILVMSSVAAIRIRRNAYLYGGAKAGLDRLCEGMADSLDGTGVTLQLLRRGRANPDDEGPGAPSLHDRSRRSRRLRDEGLETNDRVIWSPPILRYAFAMLRHLPKPIWRKVAER